MPLICPFCYRAVATGATICRHCGLSLDAAAPLEIPAAPRGPGRSPTLGVRRNAAGVLAGLARLLARLAAALGRGER